MHAQTRSALEHEGCGSGGWPEKNEGKERTDNRPLLPPHPPPHTPTRRVRRESIHAAPRVLLWTDGVFQTVMSRPAGRSEADVEPHPGGAVR